MKRTSHKTEAVYRRYAIVAESDLRAAGAKLAAELGPDTATASLSCSLGDISVTARKERSASMVTDTFGKVSAESVTQEPRVDSKVSRSA